jgi:hypothetical protein
MRAALEAYEAFDARQPGWLKVELKPGAARDGGTAAVDRGVDAQSPCVGPNVPSSAPAAEPVGHSRPYSLHRRDRRPAVRRTFSAHLRAEFAMRVIMAGAFLRAEFADACADVEHG